MSEPLLALESASIDYVTDAGTVRVLDRVSLTIAPGESVGLCGESGCGKSTLLQAILRMVPPPGVLATGAVRFDGRDVYAMGGPELRAFRWRDVSLVPQGAQHVFSPVRTIEQHLLDTIAAHETTTRPAALQRARELLDLVEIDRRRLGAYPHELSGGMRQRVAVALALALRPRLLLLDEPTTALDVVAQREILDRLAQLRARLGFAMLFVTHDLTLMFELVERVAVLYAGRIVEEAAPDEIAERPQHPYTQALLASAPRLRGPLTTLHPIVGAPPNPRQRPAGCSFAPRCSVALPKCAGESPRLLGEAHRVACFCSEAAAHGEAR